MSDVFKVECGELGRLTQMQIAHDNRCVRGEGWDIQACLGAQ